MLIKNYCQQLVFFFLQSFHSILFIPQRGQDQSDFFFLKKIPVTEGCKKAAVKINKMRCHIRTLLLKHLSSVVFHVLGDAADLKRHCNY